MGTRGPAPTPDNIRILKGNGIDRDVAHRPVARQPKAVPGIPDMPGDLGPHARRMWKHVTPELARMGILGRIDLGALEMYCRAYQEVRDHPGGRGWGVAAMTMVNIGSKLGLDPAARMRMTMPDLSDGNEESDVFGTG